MLVQLIKSLQLQPQLRRSLLLKVQSSIAGSAEGEDSTRAASAEEESTTAVLAEEEESTIAATAEEEYTTTVPTRDESTTDSAPVEESTTDTLSEDRVNKDYNLISLKEIKTWSKEANCWNF